MSIHINYVVASERFLFPGFQFTLCFLIILIITALLSKGKKNAVVNIVAMFTH